MSPCSMISCIRWTASRRRPRSRNPPSAGGSGQGRSAACLWEHRKQLRHMIQLLSPDRQGRGAVPQARRRRGNTVRHGCVHGGRPRWFGQIVYESRYNSHTACQSPASRFSSVSLALEACLRAVRSDMLCYIARKNCLHAQTPPSRASKDSEYRRDQSYSNFRTGTEMYTDLGWGSWQVVSAQRRNPLRVVAAEESVLQDPSSSFRAA